ncbi:uncharacterized protein LOC117323766 [Pecten maximus]|uniref:uncharacterized protein LOC117323766 n=1 Tax=Pecten maximus TaxID=6579 RepID=UPI0014587675|nr:uncharacterized protein LOC117323766 [Pecten maximus]
MSNVKVAVRVRPLSEKEREKNAKFIVDVSGDTVSVENIKVDGQSDFGDSRERVKNFTFDYCYDSTVEPTSPAFASQELVFQDLGTEVLQAAFEGYNACLFAYGQTSTGKTHTMMGRQEDAGLIPRICEGLFSHVDNFVDQDNLSFHVKISYLEIYNERVRDLLRPSLLKKNEKYTLKVREHPKDGPYVQDLSTHFINDNQQIQAILERGNEYRTTASTYMHDHSSRSHAIVTIEFTQAKIEDDLPHEIVSKLHLVDLAGSERADPNYWSGYKGRLREGSNINKSLVTLGNVIKALAERSILSCSSDSLGASVASIQSSPGGDGAATKKRLPYIPYRDSVLTWLLKDSLGGNSKTIMISTITPASMYYNETLSTLRYAQRAKSIINKPKVNEDPNVSLIRDLRREIERLREMLVSTRMANSRSSLNEIIFLMPPNIQKMHDIDMDSDQGDSFLQLPDSNSVLAEKLQENENMVDKLTQTWIDKWREAHEAIRDSDLSIRGLRGKSNSMGVLIESQMPHLVGMDDDILSTGVTIYYLKEGKTLLGREDADREQDIVLSGPSVQREHCFIKNMLGNVIIHPNRRANCAINGIDCRGPTRLKQGDYILLGKTNMFRFNNPAEAAKLRMSRQNLAVAGAESQENLNISDPSSPDFDRHVHPLYAHCDASEFCHQLERDFDSDPKRIEEAKRELQRVRDEHRKAEEERQLREEELWRLHESHKQEIEHQRHSLTEIAEENLTQHQRAEEELAYARDCLQQEKEAFQQYLQEELAKVQKGRTKSEFGSQTELGVVQTVDVGCDQGLQDIERKKESLQGQIKALAQGELIRCLSYRDTELRLFEEAEEIEDQYQTTQEQLNAELQQLEEVEKGYRSGDRTELQDITRTDDDLTDLDRQQKQLHQYIAEKEGLMQVGLDVPRPLRSACSEEVLTDAQTSSLGFPFRASSLLALKQGSEGDLPSMSARLSLRSSLNITSLDSIPDSVESMDTSSSLPSSSSNQGVSTRKRSTRSPASDTLTSGAKEVTSRLYTAPPPKFKYEPKQKSKVVPKTNSVRKRDVKKDTSVGVGRNIPSTESKKGTEDGKSLRKSKSPSPGRQTVPLPGRQSTPSPGRRTSPSPGKPASPAQRKQKSPQPEHTSKGEGHDKEKVSDPGSTGQSVTKRIRHGSDESGVVPRLRQSVSQPTLTLNRGLTNNPRLTPTKLRPINSATSLASVPEAVGEETEAVDNGQVTHTAVVRRRKKRQFDEDDTRRHSEPVGESLADAFEKYTQEMEASIEIPVILLHDDSPGEQVWARHHGSSVSDSDDVPSSDNTNNSDASEEVSAGQNHQSFSVIPSTSDLEVKSSVGHQISTVQEVECSQTMTGDSTAQECLNDSLGSSVDGKPTDNQCNVNSVCNVPTEQMEISFGIKPCKGDDSVFRNDLEYQQGAVRSVELDSDSGFYPESSDNFESSGAHSFAGSINSSLGRSGVGPELDPQGSMPQAVHPLLPGDVHQECDKTNAPYDKISPMNSEKPVFIASLDDSDVMESSLISPTDVSLHLSQDSESDSGKNGRKREHDHSLEDSHIDIPNKCKKDEKFPSDNVYVDCIDQEHMTVAPEHGNSQNIPQSSKQNLNSQLTFNPNFQTSSGFIVCDILQDAAKAMSADFDDVHRSYSSDSLEDADSLDGSRPRTTREQELTDSLEDSEGDQGENKSKRKKPKFDTGSLQSHEQKSDTQSLQCEQQTDTIFLQREQQTDTGFLQREQQTDTGSLQREQQTDTGSVQREQQTDTGSVQGEQQTDTGSLQGEQQTDTGSLQREQQTDTGSLQGEQQTDTGSVQGEQQTDTGSLQQEQMTDTGSVQGEQQTDTGSVQGEQQTDTGSLQGEQQTDTGSLQQEQMTDTGSQQSAVESQGCGSSEQKHSQMESSEKFQNETVPCLNDEVIEFGSNTSVSTSKSHKHSDFEVSESVSTVDLENEIFNVDKKTNLSQTDVEIFSTPVPECPAGDRTVTLTKSDVSFCSTPNTVESCDGEGSLSTDNIYPACKGDEVSEISVCEQTSSATDLPPICSGDLDSSATAEPYVMVCPGELDSSATTEPSVMVCPGEMDTSTTTKPSVMVCPGEMEATKPSVMVCPGEMDTSTTTKPSVMVCPGEMEATKPSVMVCPGEMEATKPFVMVCPGEMDTSATTEPSVMVCPGEMEATKPSVMVCPGEMDTSATTEPSVMVCPGEMEATKPSVMVCPGEMDASTTTEPSVMVCPGEMEATKPSVMVYPGEMEATKPSVMVCPGEIDTSATTKPSVMVCPGEMDASATTKPSAMVCPGELNAFVPEPSGEMSEDTSLHLNHVNNSIGVNGEHLDLGQGCISAASECESEASHTQHHPDSNQGQVISIMEVTPNQPDTKCVDILMVDSSATFKEAKNNMEDSSCQTNHPSDMNFIPISNASEDSSSQVTEQPSTRSLGIVTTPDLLIAEEDNVGGASDCSQDSIQELQEQLQQLEEFPGQKSAAPNANPPLSSSRRATRHRAMIRQKHRGVDESDDFSPESGDSLGSGNVSKPSSRPDSASKRRRRIIKSKSDRRSNLKAPSSEDYVNSESDDVCSDDSPLEPGDVKPEGLDESDPSVTYSDFAQQLSSALGEHDSHYTYECAENSEESSDKREDLKPGQSEIEFNMEDHYMNGFTSHGDDESRGAIPKKKNKHFRKRTSNGSSTSDLENDMRPSSRTPSETRDMEQQTDVSWLEFPAISSSRQKSPVLNISPLSVWNSGDRGVKASNGPHGSGGVNVSMDSRHIKKTKRTKPVKLEFTQPDVWSAGTWVEDYASSGKMDADFSSDSDDDHAYVMETEVFSPQSPSACDKFFNDGDSSDTKEDSYSVKYYVTINEENTNISYNVDRTEYKTYSLRSQIQPNEQTMSIPESININLTATDSHTSESRHTSSNSQHVYLNNSDSASSSPEQNVVVSERTFHTVHEASRDEDDVIERHFEEETTASYLELCPGTSTPHPPHVSVETGDINKNDVLSPRESDTTSDYGTMIMDNRRDYTSFTLDSGDEEGSQASGYKSHPDNQDGSPLEDKVFIIPNDDSDLSLAELRNMPSMKSEDVDSISQNGQQLCPYEQISRRNVVAGTQQLPCEPELVSNVISSDQFDRLSDGSSDIENSQFVEAESVPHSENVAQQVLDAFARMSTLTGFNAEDSDVLSVSLDRLQGPDSVSSDSSIYKTPQQSPRDDEEGDATAAIENVKIPDHPQSPQLSEGNKEILNSPTTSPSKAEQRTVSVTTDPLAGPYVRRRTVDESSVREDLKRELQQKLARLQKHVRSRSDSAISSDYTDGDSTSVSPRGSRLYESDKTLRGGLFIDQAEARYPEDIRVMVTQTRTQFDPSASGQTFSSTINRLLDIDNKTPKKSPLKDSGNVFDDSDLGEHVEDAIVPVRAVKKELSNFVPIEKDTEDSKCDNDTNVSAISDSRSLSPGELVLSPSSSGDIFESVGSGSSDLEEVYRINTNGTRPDHYDDGIVPRSLPSTQRSVKKEKSPSMSDIAVPRCDRDLKRSMSEANVDDFEEISSSESSNDSIVFVFMGQSHTTESMEKLQNEYNPLPFGNDSEPVYKPYNGNDGETNSSQSQFDCENTTSKSEDHDSDCCNIHEDQMTLESKEELKPKLSPDHTGECGYNNYNEDDNEPLRHKFGIDEAVLPIPVRSVSSDNIPKQTQSNLIVHRSRSTDLLEVNAVENPNDPSNNEGIFPPNVGSDFWDNAHGYHGDVVVIEEYYSDDSDSKKSDVVNLDKSADRFIVEEDMMERTEEITYSELIPTHPYNSRKNPPEDIDYSGNISDTGVSDHEEQYMDEFYNLPTPGTADTSKRQDSIRIVDPSGQLPSDTDIQKRLTDSSTQTEVVENPSENQQESQVLPALASPYRAQSMGNINPVDSSITLTLPESTENWENLSHIVIESTSLINNLNQKIHGIHTTPDSSQERLNFPPLKTGSRPVCEQNNLDNEAHDGTTQTTRSLTDLHNLGIQTDDEWMSFDREDSPNSNDSTQTDSDITRPRELSETETTDIIPLTVDLPVNYDRVFPPEPSKEMSCQTSPDTTVDTVDSSMQTDEFEKVLSRLSNALKNDDSGPEEIEEEIKASFVGDVKAQKTLKLSSGHITSRVQDQAVIECNNEEHHLRKHNSKQDQTQTVIIERQSVIETEANVPDMNVTNAEMEALKAEHVKMMETLKKAAEGRKSRTQELKTRLEKQTNVEHEFAGDQTGQNSSNVDTRREDRDMRSWYDTHLSSEISSKYDSSAVRRDTTTECVETTILTEKEHLPDESGDLDALFKHSHRYLGSRENLENIDDILFDNTRETSDSRTAEPLSTKSRKLRRPKETSRVQEPSTEVNEDHILPVRKSDQQSSLPSIGADENPNKLTDVSRLDSLSSLTSEGTLLGEEVSQFLNDENDGRSYNFKDDFRSGAENRTLLARNSAASEPVGDELSDREGSPRLQTPPNSPIALSNDEMRSSQFQKPQPYRRSPEVQPNYLATLRKQPPVTSLTETSGKVSTGVEVSVDNSDDFTQTDLQALKLDLTEFSINSTTQSETRTVRPKSNPSIRSELSRLQKERVEIIELLSMNYLPASLTVELLEAKLNYCIGQTDTLLKTLEETWDRTDFIVNNEHHHTDITKEYVTNYRHDLQKSKWDIQICKEKMNRTVKHGAGRGRTRTRNKDIAKWKRLEEIEAFKAERFMEQQNYERARSISPLKKASPSENERHSRSVSPSSLETSPRLMTPKQHREHLVDLRRTLVEVTERDEHAYRASRSCSPQLSHYDDTDRILSPRSSSYNCSPQTSPVHHRYSSHASPEHRYMPRTSMSPRASPERHYSPCSSPEHQHYRTDYGSTNSLSIPDQHILTLSPRSYSNSPARVHTQTRPDLYNGTYLTSRVTSASPQRTSSAHRRTQFDHEGIHDRESKGNDQLYVFQETRDLFRDMQEARMQNQQEITRAQNTLLHSTRNYSGMRSRTSSNASSRRSYSSYRDYARDLIEGSRRSIHGVVSGSYELYDDSTQHSRETGVISPPSSVVSDLESLPDSILSEQYASNTTHSNMNTDPSFLRTRPINSKDIKSRIRKHRRVPTTS